MEYESNSSLEAKFVKDLDKVGGFLLLSLTFHLCVMWCLSGQEVLMRGTESEERKWGNGKWLFHCFWGGGGFGIELILRTFHVRSK